MWDGDEVMYAVDWDPHKIYPDHNLGMTTKDSSLVMPFLSFQNKVLVPINLEFENKIYCLSFNTSDAVCQ